MPAKRIELSRGQRFGRLRYLRDAPPYVSPGGVSFRQCVFRCDCGETITVLLARVRQVKTQSCGCLVVDRNRERLTHGLASPTHPDHNLYERWYNMHERCYNPSHVSYKHYGGRGIGIVLTWHGYGGLKRFVQWSKVNGYRPDLELDRKRNHGDYGPGNCHWVTHAQNVNNRRNTLTITHPETQQTVALMDWYRERPREISYSTARRKRLTGSLK